MSRCAAGRATQAHLTGRLRRVAGRLFGRSRDASHVAVTLAAPVAAVAAGRQSIGALRLTPPLRYAAAQAHRELSARCRLSPRSRRAGRAAGRCHRADAGAGPSARGRARAHPYHWRAAFQPSRPDAAGACHPAGAELAATRRRDDRRGGLDVARAGGTASASEATGAADPSEQVADAGLDDARAAIASARPLRTAA